MDGYLVPPSSLSSSAPANPVIIATSNGPMLRIHGSALSDSVKRSDCVQPRLMILGVFEILKADSITVGSLDRLLTT